MAAHAPAQHKEELSNSMLGFILFLASEVMFFGGLFAAYFIARADSPVWPPPLSAEQIADGVELKLEIALPFIATLVLILSSVTIQLGVWAIARGDRSALIRWLFISIVLGLSFLTAQLYDYSQLPFSVDDMRAATLELIGANLMNPRRRTAVLEKAMETATVELRAQLVGLSKGQSARRSWQPPV